MKLFSAMQKMNLSFGLKTMVLLQLFVVSAESVTTYTPYTVPVTEAVSFTCFYGLEGEPNDQRCGGYSMSRTCYSQYDCLKLKTAEGNFNGQDFYAFR